MNWRPRDGFALVIAAPRLDNEPTDEFYVLACSAIKDRRLAWTRHIFWYYNVDHIFLPTSDKTRLEFQASDGKIGFELYRLATSPDTRIAAAAPSPLGQH